MHDVCRDFLKFLYIIRQEYKIIYSCSTTYWGESNRGLPKVDWTCEEKAKRGSSETNGSNGR